MIRKLTFTLLFFLLLTPVLSQFATTLTSINSCLGSCATCAYDQLQTCSSCVEGYQGSDCSLSPAFTAEERLIHSSPTGPKSAFQWANSSTSKCLYTNSTENTVDIQVYGPYNGQASNSITVDLLPIYQNAIVYFNLIRSSWAPFSDYVTLTFEADGVSLGLYFIQYHVRDEINSNTNKVSCGGLTRINDKFQVYLAIPQKIRQQKLTVTFDGNVMSGAVWSITNFQIVFGCDNFFIVNSTTQSCSICPQNYFINQITKFCEKCPASCQTCTAQACSSCLSNYKLVGGSCISQHEKYVIKTYKVTGTKNTCNLVLSNFKTDQTILSSRAQIDGHKSLSVSILANIAYIPNQWKGNQNVQIWVNGELKGSLKGSSLAGRETGKKTCAQFNAEYGFYSLTQISIFSYSTKATEINLELRVKSKLTLGISQITVQYQPEDPVKVQPEPIIPPPEQKPQQPIQEKPEEPIQPQPEEPIQPQPEEPIQPQPEEPIPPTPRNNNAEPAEQKAQNKTNKPQMKVLANLQQLSDNKDELVFEWQSGDSLWLRISYPFAISHADSFPFLALVNGNETYDCVTASSGPYFRLCKVDVKESLLEKSLTVLAQNMKHQNQKEQTEKENNQGNNDSSDMIILSSSSPSSGNLTQQKIGVVKITRYDYLSEGEWETTSGLAKFFQIIAWITIIATITLSCLGNSVITQELSILLQLVFLHVYIYTEYLPATFKHALAGFSRMENLNYFLSRHQQTIQGFLLPGILQQTPLKFISMGHRDINFTRSLYPTLIITLGYLLSFVVLNLLKKKLEPNLVIKSEQEINSTQDRLSLFVIRTGERWLNFWYQIWQYQYITVIWAVAIQSYKFTYPKGTSIGLQYPNLIFCFIVFAVFLVLPPLTLAYLNKKYFRLDYFEYCYWYENVFYMKLPEESLPCNHHRVLIVVRNIRYVLIVVSLAALNSQPLAVLLFISFLNVCSLVYYKVTQVEISSTLNVLNWAEHLLLIVLELLMMVGFGISSSASTKSYLSLGKGMVAVVFFLLGVGLARAGFLAYNKVQQREEKPELLDFRPAIATERVV